jgi:ribosomal protein L1
MTVQEHPNGEEFRPVRDAMTASQQLDQHLATAIADLSTVPTEKPAMTAPAPGSFAASLKAIVDDARAGLAQQRVDGVAQVQAAVGKINEAKAAVAHVTSSMAKTIEDEAAAVLSELGQISNDLGV